MSKVQGVVVEDDDALVRDHVGRRRAFGCDAERVRDAEHEREPGQFRKRKIVSPHSILPAAIPRLERLKGHPAPRNGRCPVHSRKKLWHVISFSVNTDGKEYPETRATPWRRQDARADDVEAAHARTSPRSSISLNARAPNGLVGFHRTATRVTAGRVHLLDGVDAVIEVQRLGSVDGLGAAPASQEKPGRRFWFSWAALVRTRKLIERAGAGVAAVGAGADDVTTMGYFAHAARPTSEAISASTSVVDFRCEYMALPLPG
jgi:hypothetical protein